ncbi:hypothetical protein COL93_27145 [Bacillus toyonensis]|uniref:Uncharacterized protein n=1 Tax=Bacillus toyonensis TaxID=155322 RepID=A0A2B5X6E8_9BACI|nr:hypothetical protein COL93_27145 [Bacillus toyonensis]PHD67954.1 hypothetical protein COF40_18470 [Bacillus toyonensis]
MNIKNFDLNKWFTSFIYKLILLSIYYKKFPFKKNERNFKSAFTFVRLRVRMKLLKDIGSEDNEHSKVN